MCGHTLRLNKKGNAMRVLVTRPGKDGQDLVKNLGDLGIDSMLEPLLTIRNLNTNSLNTEDVQAYLSTSANGINALINANPDYSIPLFAVGDATAVTARIGTVQVAAHQIASQTWFLLAMAMDAMAIAAQAMVGNLLGSGQAYEARRVGNRVIAWSIGIGLALGVVLVAGVTGAGDTVPGIFSADPAVIALVGFLLLHVATMAPLSGLAFALDGILIGAGDQRFLAQAMGASFAIFVPAAVIGRTMGAGIGWLWGAIWLFMTVRSALLFVRFRGTQWQVLGTAN